LQNYYRLFAAECQEFFEIFLSLAGKVFLADAFPIECLQQKE